MRLVVTLIVLVLAGPVFCQQPAAPTSGTDSLAASLGAGFVRYPHGRFDVLSDAGSRTRDALRVADRCVTEFARFLDRMGFEPSAPDRSRPTIVLFADASAYAAFASRTERLVNPWMGGYYSVHNNRLVLFDDRSGESYARAKSKLDEYESEGLRRLDSARHAKGEAAEATRRSAQEALERVASERARLENEASRSLAEKMAHEMTHLLSYNSGLQSPFVQSPFWVSEGLATNFESRETERAFGPDHLDAGRFREFVALADTGRLMPVASLVQLTSVPQGDGDAAHDLYTQAYVLFNYLFRHRRDDLARFLGILRSDEEVGADSAPAFAREFADCFGEIEILERQVLDDARRQSLR